MKSEGSTFQTVEIGQNDDGDKVCEGDDGSQTVLDFLFLRKPWWASGVLCILKRLLFWFGGGGWSSVAE